jgi:putative intracellular protease/amidase
MAVAVVLGASGSVITDALGPYEVFARCPEFFVYTVSARPAAVLSGALAAVPDYSLRDVDAGTAPEPAVVVIPAVVSPNGGKEQPLREWLARRAGRGAHLLGVCAGARLLAAAGCSTGTGPPPTGRGSGACSAPARRWTGCAASAISRTATSLPPPG